MAYPSSILRRAWFWMQMAFKCSILATAAITKPFNFSSNADSSELLSHINVKLSGNKLRNSRNFKCKQADGIWNIFGQYSVTIFKNFKPPYISAFRWIVSISGSYKIIIENAGNATLLNRMFPLKYQSSSKFQFLSCLYEKWNQIKIQIYRL